MAPSRKEPGLCLFHAEQEWFLIGSLISRRSLPRARHRVDTGLIVLTRHRGKQSHLTGTIRRRNGTTVVCPNVVVKCRYLFLCKQNLELRASQAAILVLCVPGGGVEDYAAN